MRSPQSLKVLALLLVAAVLLGGCQALRFARPDQESALLPAARSETRALQDLSRYTIQVTLDPANHGYYGSLQLEYTNAEQVPLDRLYFRLYPNAGRIYGDGSLLVPDASVDGEPVQTSLLVENTALLVPFPAPLASGDRTKISLDFTGLVPLGFGGADSEAYGIFHQTEDTLVLMSWYPILAVYDQEGWNLDPVYPVGDAVYSDAAYYTVDITTPQGLILAVTGASLGEQQVAAGVLHRYVSGPVRDFAITASPSFQVSSQKVGGTLVSSYYQAGEETGARYALDVAAGAVEVFNEKFGLYPYTELDVVAAPMHRATGMEMPGLILLDSEEYADYQDPAFLDLVAHEVAHQWWYGLVGNDVIEEPWLDEALTTYSGALYAQAALSQANYEGVMTFRRGRYGQMVAEGHDAPIDSPVVDFINRGDPDSYAPIVYSKGAIFFEDLRQEIGDAAFFTALQAYFMLYRYKIATAADLLAAFETASGNDLTAFYQQWVHTLP